MKHRNVARRGSVLVMAIWVVAILSMLVINYAGEAYIQARLNQYMRERVHVNRITDSGLRLAEMIMAEFSSVKDWQEDQDDEEELEENRWFLEMQNLKAGKDAKGETEFMVTIDDQDPDAGFVKVHIKSLGGGGAGASKININTLYAGGNPNAAQWWEGILTWAGVPNPKATHGTRGISRQGIDKSDDTEDYWDEIVSSWTDWRDEDDGKTGENGAEKEWYRDYYEDHSDIPEKNYAYPRNGEIPTLNELVKVRGFMFHPALLGVGERFFEIPEDASEAERKELEMDENNPRVRNLMEIFDVVGGDKINANMASADVLATIPGIYSSTDDTIDPMALAQAVVAAREEPRSENGEEGGPFKNWDDFYQRMVTDLGTDIGTEAQNYLSFDPPTGDGAQFEVEVTGYSSGISHTVRAIYMIIDSVPRVIRWEEDP